MQANTAQFVREVHALMDALPKADRDAFKAYCAYKIQHHSQQGEMTETEKHGKRISTAIAEHF